jgi:hypothetical protein
VKRFKVGDLVYTKYGHVGVIIEIAQVWDYYIKYSGSDVRNLIDDYYIVSKAIYNNKLNKVLYPDWIEKGEWLHENFND